MTPPIWTWHSGMVCRWQHWIADWKKRDAVRASKYCWGHGGRNRGGTGRNSARGLTLGRFLRTNGGAFGKAHNRHRPLGKRHGVRIHCELRVLDAAVRGERATSRRPKIRAIILDALNTHQTSSVMPSRVAGKSAPEAGVAFHHRRFCVVFLGCRALLRLALDFAVVVKSPYHKRASGATSARTSWRTRRSGLAPKTRCGSPRTGNRPAPSTLVASAPTPSQGCARWPTAGRSGSRPWCRQCLRTARAWC